MTHNTEQLIPDTEGEWRYVETNLSAVVEVGRFHLRAHFNGLQDGDEIRAIMRQIVVDHKAAKSQALLVEALRESKSLLESDNELARVIAEPKVLGLIDAALKAAGVNEK